MAYKGPEEKEETIISSESTSADNKNRLVLMLVWKML